MSQKRQGFQHPLIFVIDIFDTVRVLVVIVGYVQTTSQLSDRCSPCGSPTTLKQSSPFQAHNATAHSERWISVQQEELCPCGVGPQASSVWFPMHCLRHPDFLLRTDISIVFAHAFEQYIGYVSRPCLLTLVIVLESTGILVHDYM
ncbi:unnamed protein product [Ectocarpus sp. 4 AP-2014]